MFHRTVRLRRRNEYCIRCIPAVHSGTVTIFVDGFICGTGPRLDSVTFLTPRLDPFLFFSAPKRHNPTSTNQQPNNPKKVNSVHRHCTIQQNLFQGRAGSIWHTTNQPGILFFRRPQRGRRPPRGVVHHGALLARVIPNSQDTTVGNDRHIYTTLISSPGNINDEE